MKLFTFYSIIISAILICNTLAQIALSTTDIALKLHSSLNITVDIKNVTSLGSLAFSPETKNIVKITPSQQNIRRDGNYAILVEAINPGHSIVDGNFSIDADVSIVHFRATVYKQLELDTISIIIGWIYFVAWSVSFYPQIRSNYIRKSVIGLNFDFLYLNVIGFSLYSIFNLGLYFSERVKSEYFARHPGGLNPVQVNDIVFAVHAAFACAITILQTYRYESGEQRVSTTARCILTFYATGLLISICLAISDVIHWLDFLYVCSYVKLTITLIKYMPQAYMNYQRKSTVGWSIGNILLDFTGGILSMLQMIINAFNYDDWASIFGDLTKFGLGLFSVCFDAIFIVQHYVLYKHLHYEAK